MRHIDLEQKALSDFQNANGLLTYVFIHHIIQIVH